MSTHDYELLTKISARYYNWGQTARLYSYRANALIEFWVSTYYPVRVQPVSIMDNFIICLFMTFGDTPASSYRIVTFNMRDKNIWTQLISI